MLVEDTLGRVEVARVEVEVNEGAVTPPYEVRPPCTSDAPATSKMYPVVLVESVPMSTTCVGSGVNTERLSLDVAHDDAPPEPERSDDHVRTPPTTLSTWPFEPKVERPVPPWAVSTTPVRLVELIDTLFSVPPVIVGFVSVVLVSESMRVFCANGIVPTNAFDPLVFAAVMPLMRALILFSS